MLLAAGADAEASDTHGWTALMLAARYGNSRVVEVILLVHSSSPQGQFVFLVYHSENNTVPNVIPSIRYVSS